MSIERKEDAAKNSENMGLLFGYHKELYKEKYKKPSFVKQCCAVYCARGSNTLFTLSFSVAFIIIGTLCTIYGYFLPSMYLSLTPNVGANMTITDSDGQGKSRLEQEAKSLNDMYHARDRFVLAGLTIVFLGGLVMSLSLLLPLCIGKGTERLPSSSHITVRNELGGRNIRATDNCLNSYTEETSH